jgi:hypothetical protein
LGNNNTNPSSTPSPLVAQLPSFTSSSLSWFHNLLLSPSSPNRNYYS